MIMFSPTKAKWRIRVEWIGVEKESFSINCEVTITFLAI